MGAAVNKTFLGVNTWLLAADTGNLLQETEIGEMAQNAARMAVQAFNGNWQELASGKSYIYEATVKVSLGFAAMLIAFWAIPFFNTLIKDGFVSDKTISELIWPLVVIFGLAINNGSLLSSTSLLFRNTANYLNNQILGVAINGIKVEQAIRKTNMNQAYQQILNEKVAQCRSLPNSDVNQDGKDSQTACTDEAVNQVKKAAQEYNNTNIGFDFKFDFDVGKFVTREFNKQIQTALLLIFSTFQMGFVFLIEIASILNAYIAPIFLSLSLLPGQSKLIHVWLSGWLGLGLVKISYTLIIGIATSSMVNAQDSDLLLLPLLEGVLSPILALAIASGGAMALFNGLTSAGGGSMRFLMQAGMSRSPSRSTTKDEPIKNSRKRVNKA